MARVVNTCFIVLLSTCPYPAHAQGFDLERPKVKDSLAHNTPRLYNLDKPVISPDLYTTGFGFFCKQELKLEKKNLPLKFRVGDPEYSNYLESKGHTAAPLK